jgi:hypothetical protein
VPGFRPYFVFSAILSLFFSKITLFLANNRETGSYLTAHTAKFIRGRAILSDCRQPFDEPLLPDVPPADFVESAKEVFDRALFLGERPEIG